MVQEFKNKLMDECLTQRGIHHSFTPPYHPQANPVERANRTVKTMIRAYVFEHHGTWDAKFGEIIFAYNSSRHTSTGVSPFFLETGRHPRATQTLRHEADDAARQGQQRESIDKWMARMRRLSGLQDSAPENNRRQSERSARYYNAKRRDVTYEVGNQVWRTNKVLSSGAQGVSGKLVPRYVGPFRVTKRLGSNTYQLTNEKGETEGPVHVTQMKLYVTDRPDEDVPTGHSQEEDVEPQPPEEGSRAGRSRACFVCGTPGVNHTKNCPNWRTHTQYVKTASGRYVRRPE